jgi:putative metallohydrolase (TIGR04338 family)
VQAFIDHVSARVLFKKKYPLYETVQVVLRPGKRARRAYATSEEVNGVTVHSITLPRVYRRKWVILHEMAHILNNLHTPDPKAPHGWQFCLIYLDLVTRGMGSPSKKALKQAFKANNVYTWEKKRSAHTEEHRKMLSDRMKRINAERNAQRNS